MSAEESTNPMSQVVRIENPDPCVNEPLDVEVDIYIPMEPRKTNLGKRVVSSVGDAKPCIIEPFDVEVDIYVPMPVKSVRMGKRIVKATTKAPPCLILPELPVD